MAPTFVQLALSAFLVTALSVTAETHTVSFTNNCGKGTPQLVLGGKVVSNGTAYTQSGVINGIAYLQTGPCLLNGEECALLEFNLANPTVPGGGSSTDISLISPHELNVPVGFNYYNGCDGSGTQCLTGDCHTAFFQPDDNQVQVACQEDNVDLMITFCPSGSSSSSDDTSSGSGAQSSAVSSTQNAATTSAPAAASSDVVTAAAVASSASESATTSVKHVAAATSVESVANTSTIASAASSAPTTRVSSKTCKAKAASSKRSKQSSAKRAGAWHHRSRNAHAAF